jgi:hypothetical protein
MQWKISLILLILHLVTFGVFNFVIINDCFSIELFSWFQIWFHGGRIGSGSTTCARIACDFLSLCDNYIFRIRGVDIFSLLLLTRVCIFSTAFMIIRQWGAGILHGIFIKSFNFKNFILFLKLKPNSLRCGAYTTNCASNSHHQSSTDILNWFNTVNPRQYNCKHFVVLYSTAWWPW